jgi:hypothetical protein
MTHQRYRYGRVLFRWFEPDETAPSTMDGPEQAELPAL